MPIEYTEFHTIIHGRTIRDLDEIAAFVADFAQARREGAVTRFDKLMTERGKRFGFALPADVYGPAQRRGLAMAPLNAVFFEGSNGKTYRGTAGAIGDVCDIGDGRWYADFREVGGRLWVTFTARGPESNPPPEVWVAAAYVDRTML